MSIQINERLCLGCRSCLKVCPGDLIEIGPSGYPIITEPELCWGCSACLKSCPHEALALFLSPSLGGLGLGLTVSKDEQRLKWRAFKDDFEIFLITDPQSSGY